MTTKKTKKIKKNIRKRVDWEKAEKLFRMGRYSSAELGRIFEVPTSTITRHMKNKGVLADKSDEVRARTKAALLADATENATKSKKPRTRTQLNATISDVTESDLEKAVMENVALVRSHRKDIQELARVERELLEKFIKDPQKLFITQYQGKIVDKKLSLTVPELAAALSNLSNVISRRIKLEREAFGINDTDPVGSSEVKEITFTVVKP